VLVESRGASGLRISHIMNDHSGKERNDLGLIMLRRPRKLKKA
jgi:hypothetical protein